MGKSRRGSTVLKKVADDKATKRADALAEAQRASSRTGPAVTLADEDQMDAPAVATASAPQASAATSTSVADAVAAAAGGFGPVQRPAIMHSIVFDKPPASVPPSNDAMLRQKIDLLMRQRPMDTSAWPSVRLADEPQIGGTFSPADPIVRNFASRPTITLGDEPQMGGDFVPPTPVMRGSGSFPTVTLADEAQIEIGPRPRFTPNGLAPNDFDYVPQPEPVNPKPQQTPPKTMPEPTPKTPRKPYTVGNSLTGNLVMGAYKTAAPYVRPVVSGAAAAGLDAALITTLASLAYRMGKPMVRDAYNAMYPGSATAEPPSPQPQQSTAPQQPAPQQQEVPDYIRELNDSTIGDRNSTDIIRYLTRNRGMA